MTPTTRFSLAPARGPRDTRPLRLPLYDGGQRTGTELPGWRLVYQAHAADRYLLVTEYDHPGEQTSVFVLLDRQLRVLGWRRIGPMLSFMSFTDSAFSLADMRWKDTEHFRATGTDGSCWEGVLRARPVPLLFPALGLSKACGAPP